MALLQKTRKINAMLQNAAGKPVNFKEMAERFAMRLIRTFSSSAAEESFSVSRSTSRSKMTG